MTKTEAELLAGWWEAWWAADFSWAGLAGKPLGSSDDDAPLGLRGETNLQAYWRRDPLTGLTRDDAEMRAAGELVTSPDGEVWHVAHVPLRWRDDAPAKEAWDEAARVRLRAIVALRLGETSEVEGGFDGGAAKPDGRAQFAGTVLPLPLAPPEGTGQALRAVCVRALFGSPRAPGQIIGAGFRADRALLLAPAAFRGAEFGGSSSFNGAIFLGRADFDSARFLGWCDFSGGVFQADATFQGARFRVATFTGAAIAGSAGFAGAEFEAWASFGAAVFSGPTSFFGTRFSGADFKGARFDTRANFGSARFAGPTSFTGAAFPRGVAFGHAEFQSAWFEDAAFADLVSFQQASFGGTVDFQRAGFSGKTDFGGAGFSGEVAFKGAITAGSVGFAACTFERLASFEGAHVEPPGHLSFRACRFNGITIMDRVVCLGRLDFTAAQFARLASFAAINWPNAAADWQGMFNQAVFKDLASFQGAGLQRFAAFDGAILQGGLQLDGAAEPDANATFRRELSQAEALEDSEGSLRHLEGGCRVLKQAMEKSANKTREQMFYAFELMARRHQRATPWWERQISWLYSAAADYGRSIGRPLLWLALLIPLFAVVYAGMIQTWRSPAVAGLTQRLVAIESLSFSAQRVLPFGPWALTPQQISKSPVQSLLQGPSDALFSLAVRALATLQSLAALVLAFLAGLAIRRRFQIN